MASSFAYGCVDGGEGAAAPRTSTLDYADNRRGDDVGFWRGGGHFESDIPTISLRARADDDARIFAGHLFRAGDVHWRKAVDEDVGRVVLSIGYEALSLKEAQATVRKDALSILERRNANLQSACYEGG